MTCINQQNGKSFGNVSLGQIFYFRDRKTTLPGEAIRDEMSSPIVAEINTAIIKNWIIGGDIQWDPNLGDETEKITDFLFHPVSQRLLPDYPAHLHIDLLSRAQGKGQGKLLMDRFIGYLKYNKIPGLHLELSSNNDRAFNFYRKYGIEELDRDNESIIMGYHL